jgi:hypothetical protein
VILCDLNIFDNIFIRFFFVNRHDIDRLDVILYSNEPGIHTDDIEISLLVIFQFLHIMFHVSQ